MTDPQKWLAERITTPQERAGTSRERRYQFERDVLVAVLSKVWPSHLKQAADDTLLWSEVVCIHSPAGLLPWTVPPDRTVLFAHLEHADLESCRDDKTSASTRDGRLRELLRMLVLPPPPPAPATKKRRRKS